jgi:hypothetical protein
MLKDDQILNLLSDLHAFNLLTEKIVLLISVNFNVDAEKICKENGITYNT